MIDYEKELKRLYKELNRAKQRGKIHKQAVYLNELSKLKIKMRESNISLKER